MNSLPDSKKASSIVAKTLSCYVDLNDLVYRHRYAMVSCFGLYMFCSAAIYGGFTYSPIPFWDMWDGLVSFVLKVKQGDYADWFAQHNEHRILLSRMLFWIDGYFFSLRNSFLIIVNYILVVCIVIVFFLYAKKLKSARENPDNAIFVWIFVAGLLFLLTQQENFVWGFQSQFFLAQLLPLFGLYSLAKYAETRKLVSFNIAFITLGLCEWTMANGLLVTPFAVLFSIFFRLGWKPTAALLALTVFELTTYFYNYIQPGGHGGIITSLMGYKIELVKYYLVYFGNVEYEIFNFTTANWTAAYIGGALFCLSSLAILVASWKRKFLSPYVGALVAFILYVHASALITACGRVIFGIDQALSPRYTTPVIMAMSASIVAGWALFPVRLPAVRHSLISLFFISGVVIIQYQTSKLIKAHEPYVRKVAALGMVLEINDPAILKSLYPDTDFVYSNSTQMRKLGWSFYSEWPYYEAASQLGARSAASESVLCNAVLERSESVGTNARFKRITGHLDKSFESSAEFLTLSAADGKISGFAFKEFHSEIAKLFNFRHRGVAQFQGYVEVEALASNLTISVNGRSCPLSLP